MNTIDAKEMERVAALMVKPNAVFVFGSNEQGQHGGGAAATAKALYGAVWGQGDGHRGRSYAIPTKRDYARQLPLPQLTAYVDRFLDYARAHPDLTFAVTRIGCGLAGFTDEQIAPLFASAPENCELPGGWRTPWRRGTSPKENDRG